MPPPLAAPPSINMRLLRFLLSLSTSLVAVILLLYIFLVSPQDGDLERASLPSTKTSYNARFSFTSPSSLFPPSAIISLTDDNSTFFLARPAAFGPDLPNDGLSGPLWIGNGFGDDNMDKGELGCSDIPGWNDDKDDLLGLSLHFKHPQSKSKQITPSSDTTIRQDTTLDGTAELLGEFSTNDGTDDHLQSSMRNLHKAQDGSYGGIRPIQESAEMAGKIALLKRGGCGFLAKVQWAQRRGATAVIVGDDVRGGALVRMYAKGDTSNITIPSLFTSHTTAHLLSSLTPPSQTLQGVQGVNNGQFDKTVEEDLDLSRSVKDDDSANWPPALDVVHQKEQPDSRSEEVSHSTAKRTSIARGIFSWISFGKIDRAAPKANHKWYLSTNEFVRAEAVDWNDKQKHIKTNAAILGSAPTSASTTFAAGNNNWRADLPFLPSATSGLRKMTSSAENIPSGKRVYAEDGMVSTKQKVWRGEPSNFNQDTSILTSSKLAKAKKRTHITGDQANTIETSPHEPISHRGLWVTLTPTNVSTSPFFDTLLVLVVSPLVTLTVVYALLLLRSRIRRRRWRAPKSVVERLPVRTYQTISDSMSSATPSASSPATPLLQNSPSQSVSSLSSPSSREESEPTVTASSARQKSRDREEEKRESGLAAWRRRYCGRQKECVVCLEEYEDGVSRVMSLPCGHEFHADCITPWLVTRRRTCPICKGDVVRSLSQSYQDDPQSASPTRFSQFPQDEDSVQAQAAETRNDSPSASRPVPSSTSASHGPLQPGGGDIEAVWSEREARHDGGSPSEGRPDEMSTSLRELRSSVSAMVWRGVEAVRQTTGLQRRPPPDNVDRNR